MAASGRINDYGPYQRLWGATMLGTILVVILILALIGAFPRWGYSSGWGYGPSGIVGVILIVVLILALTGRV
jgi:multisubunit Na+/H+ antiporter MnhG subunit